MLNVILVWTVFFNKYVLFCLNMQLTGGFQEWTFYKINKSQFMTNYLKQGLSQEWGPFLPKLNASAKLLAAERHFFPIFRDRLIYFQNVHARCYSWSIILGKLDRT